MFNSNYNRGRWPLWVLISSVLFCFGFAQSNAQDQSATPVEVFRHSPARGMGKWKSFHSAPGKCSVYFPGHPEHVQQVMPVDQGGYHLRYDVYVAAFERKAVYMMLIAQYPADIKGVQDQLRLESILNGLLMQNQDSRLIFADLVEVEGNRALDFFIEAKGVYFKGRVLLAENNLYLLAMECDRKNYLEDHYNYFINSFKLAK